MQFLASSIEGADHQVDLFDPLACLLVGLAVLGVLKATSEVALCSGPCRWHAGQGTRNVHVTHIAPPVGGRQRSTQVTSVGLHGSERARLPKAPDR
jgi:hypothetical protein